MKNLQDSEVTSYTLPTTWPLDVVEFRPEAPSSIVILLHGYNERGLRIFRKLKRALPLSTLILAPNGIFPLPRAKPDKLDFGYAWYFFDKFAQSYVVDQSHGVNLLKKLIDANNPENLPVTVIGFSQGGYLAPFLGHACPQVKHVIGIGCEFRSTFFKAPPSFTLAAIHGEADPLVSATHAKKEIDKLQLQGISVDWHLIPDLKHEITMDVANVVKQLLEQYGKASL